MNQNQVSISMIRANLDAIPHFALPPPYAFKWYETGDEKLWLEIQTRADRYNSISPELFDRQFGGNTEALAERQCFLVDARGAAVGTATAWFNDDYNGQAYGRVHWVAIVPEVQGRGLAKPLMTAVCNRLRELGHERAYLTTSPVRIPAINLYLKFGFVPEIKNAAETEVWRDIQTKLEGRC